MAQIQPSRESRPSKPGRKAARYAIPIAVAGLAAASVGLVPAFANVGGPDLPKVSAQELVEKMAASESRHMSGTVKVSTDLGLPELPGAGGGSGQRGGGMFGGGPHGDDGDGRDGEAGATPQEKLMELSSGEHTLRVAADGPDKQRVSVVEEAAEYSYIHNGDEVWVYDSGSDTALHTVVPGAGDGAKREKGPHSVTPQEAARQVLKASRDTTSVSVDGTAQVAGRDAYQLLVKPKGAPHSTVESVRIAVDAENGTPLKFTLDAKGGGAPAVEIAYKKVDFGKPSAGTFEFEPPKGTDVTERKLDRGALEKHADKPGKRDKPADGGIRPDAGLDTLGEGWGTVAELKGPRDAAGGLPGMGGGSAGDDSKSPQAEQLLDGFTEKAEGDFGKGRVFSTRLVNALMTEDGKVYVGAVTKEGLVKAAEAAAE